jgi:hypothetical protein
MKTRGELAWLSTPRTPNDEKRSEFQHLRAAGTRLATADYPLGHL